MVYALCDENRSDCSALGSLVEHQPTEFKYFTLISGVFIATVLVSYMPPPDVPPSPGK